MAFDSQLLAADLRGSIFDPGGTARGYGAQRAHWRSGSGLVDSEPLARGIGCSSHIPAKAQDQSLDATSVSGRPSNWAVVYLSHLRRCGAEHPVSEECRVLATHHAGLSYEESSRFLKAAQGFPGFQVAQTRGTERVLERVLERVAVDAVGKQPTTPSLPSSSLAPECRQRKRRVKSTFDSPAETLRSAPAYSGPPETKTAAYGLTGNDTKETAQMCEKRSKERDKRMEGILGESDSRTASHTSTPPSTTGGSPVLDTSSLAASKSPWRSSAATICSLHYPSTTSGVSASTSVLQPMQDTSVQLTSDSPLVTPTPAVAFALSAGGTTPYTSRLTTDASDSSPPVSCSPAPLSCLPTSLSCSAAPLSCSVAPLSFSAALSCSPMSLLAALTPILLPAHSGMVLECNVPQPAVTLPPSPFGSCSGALPPDLLPVPEQPPAPTPVSLKPSTRCAARSTSRRHSSDRCSASTAALTAEDRPETCGYFLDNGKDPPIFPMNVTVGVESRTFGVGCMTSRVHRLRATSSRAREYRGLCGVAWARSLIDPWVQSSGESVKVGFFITFHYSSNPPPLSTIYHHLRPFEPGQTRDWIV
ncbi:hypothetical protein DFH06DRAFT_1301478 [Mycena polygramma]|nr:hypothetical protein DFH06DRAFT_1301478 [Mycena polygramma]